MATNRDLLKEAIADAKAVKETAIANAKAALEEAFTPQLKSMFAAKLQEMEDEDLTEDGFGKGSTDGTEGFSSMDEKALDETEDDTVMEVDLEEILAELNEDEVEENLNEAEEEEVEDVEASEEESEEGEEEGEPLDLEDLTDEDLKDMIEDVIKDMIGKGELEAGHEGMESEEGAEEVSVEDEEEVDLAELLKEIEEMEENEQPVNEFYAGGASIDPVLGAWTMGIFGVVFSTVIAAVYRKFKKDEKLQSMKDSDVVKIAAKDKEFQSSPEAQQALKGEAAELAVDAKANIAENSKLDEAYKTIEVLKSELNEINLLNAKLLYTNKIFKAKNLNENQKVKVLSSFDKAKNVGEVKMVFETLNEGIKVSKNIIKENLGSASKGTMAPNVKKPIVESNEVFLRMQKLAGII